jgi:hemoglobin/transferrin/lactoferrin receptor protein
LPFTHVKPRRLSPMLAAAVSVHLASAASVATGASVPQAGAADDALETVSVYARRLTPMSSVAATVTTITDVDIDRTLATDVKQMVRYEPGLSVSKDPFRFGLDTFTVRGMTGNRVAVQVDGVPSAPGFAIGSYSNSGRAFVDLAFVQRVEVLRGPASSLYGSDAIGGVVAMTTFTPASLLADGQSSALQTEGGYDGSDDGWHGAAIGAAHLGSAALLLGYVHRQGREADTAADVTPDPSQYRSDSAIVTMVVGAAPGGPLTLTAEGGRLHQSTDVDAWELLAGSRFANTEVLRGSDDGSRFRVSASQRVPACGNAWDSATWTLYGQGTDTSQDTYEQRRAVPPPRPERPGTPPVRIDRQFRFDERAIGGGFTALKDVSDGSWTHSLTYGLQVAGTRLEELRNGTQTDLDTGETIKTVLGETYPLRDFPDTDVVEAGLFVQDEIGFGEDRWSVIPALRVDYYDLTPKPDGVYREDNPDTPVVGLHDTSVSPKLGLLLRLGGSATLYAQYSNGFRAPSPEDVNIGLDLPLLNIKAIPNPDLKPEKSNGYEVGMRRDGDGLRFSVAGYLNEYDNFIESKVNLGADPETGVIVFQSQNIARARIYGSEVSATVPLGAWIEGMQGWTTRVSGAWSRGEDLTRNEPLNSVDPGKALLSVAYDAPSGAWRAELVATSVAAKRQVDDSRVELYRTDAYVALDLLARANLGHGLTVDAGLFNLTNQSYIEWADVRGRPVGDPLIPYYTNPGRNLAVILRWRH